jgi:hypothetical protein
MIWLNPWAWLGAVAIAIPIAVHLLGRRHPRRQAFPTLRFLPASRLLPSRRARPVDLPLMAARIAIVLLAAAALAQPVFVSRTPTATGNAIVRAVIVDAGPSMNRNATAGGRAIDAARAAADRLSREAARATVIESADPRSAIPGASAWLAASPYRRELVVVSDFQTGAVDASDLEGVPPGTGVKLVRIDVSAGSEPARQTSRARGLEIDTEATGAGDTVNVRWMPRLPAPVSPAPGDAVLMLAGAAETSQADAALTAALAVGAPKAIRADRAVAIVFPNFEGRSALLGEGRDPDRPWMFDVMRAASAPLAKSGRVRDHDRLLLFAPGAPGTVESAAMTANVLRALAGSIALAEQAGPVVGDDTLRSWERPATAGSVPPGAHAPESSRGRWLWVAALGLLAIEWRMRRGAADPAPAQVTHERVA